ncbi:hypothetical protein cyc_08851 [Cyclospora cayetanensis]|uniref:Secreted protein n=1 Tax=Cyclospora cayetanensis TaxID=88456 RepID=A0A1D3CW12_9EIME|nr:hypothetical protein cyc_08851 [Cyclospora cayetanensis]
MLPCLLRALGAAVSVALNPPVGAVLRFARHAKQTLEAAMAGRGANSSNCSTKCRNGFGRCFMPSAASSCEACLGGWLFSSRDTAH